MTTKTQQVHLKALLAGGCFWGVQDLIRKLPGVLKSQVGYTGGHTLNPTYKDICQGNTDHTEAVLIDFDPSLITYDEILDYFFRLHDPTTLNQQGNDRGTQYRSAIFYFDEPQKTQALAAIERAQKQWLRPILTQIIAAQTFYPAEAEHQDYLQKNPQGYTCHYLR